MWLVARYLPVSFFSLKSASATASGGKSLLVPTPYAVKMALLDAAIRTQGVAEGERLFPLIRDLAIALELPEDVVLVKSFSKIRRHYESKEARKKDETPEAFEAKMQEKIADRIERGQYPLYATIAYREYIYYRDAFRLAFSSNDQAFLTETLPQLVLAINYFGKRGGFVQLTEPPEQIEQLPETRFISLTDDIQGTFRMDGTLQMLDDCGKTLTFQRANIYSQERITLGKERLLRHVVLPYRVLRSSRSYSWYRYADEGTRQ